MTVGEKVLAGFCATVVVVVIGGIFIGGWLGIVPRLNAKFGANRPVNLGVQYTQADYNSFMSKTSSQIFPYEEAPVKPVRFSDTILYTSPVEKDVILSNAEMSARVNYSVWKDLPISNAQIRGNKDGTVDISGRLISERLWSFVAIAGYGSYTMPEAKAAVADLKKAGRNPAFHVKAKVTVVNGAIKMDVVSAKINRYGLSKDVANKALSGGLAALMSRMSYLNVKSLSFSDTGMHFVGTMPTKLYVMQ